MADKQNITIAIEPDLLQKIRAVAARRGCSVSALLEAELRRLVTEGAQYAADCQRAFALFATVCLSRVAHSTETNSTNHPGLALSLIFRFQAACEAHRALASL